MLIDLKDSLIFVKSPEENKQGLNGPSFFFFLFTQYLLRTHYVLGPLPGVENAAGIKTDTSLYEMGENNHFHWSQVCGDV